MEFIQGLMFLSGQFAAAVFSAVAVPLAILIGFRAKWNISRMLKEIGAVLLAFVIVSGFFISVGSYGHKEEANQWVKEMEAMKK
ncbi:hypothetical protein H1164_17045 [Thermoactinomyces daqus]|uniref:Uncharacterized protein n=1 Tax=Thermoactinomyces daqus TaxID=1329516 RepID=A0A7W1XDH7_9BACL|nr:MULTISPECIES: hypothetical protein [Thermoactinomyces]MBA4544538.1 hypothetical protein [Thermoactinomyces daqus]MBH8605913.1 hypothetical protein [Thermoactinomyces sp. CICC 10522]